MPRRPASVTQADVARALRACKNAGVLGEVVVCLEGGAITIKPLDCDADRHKASPPVDADAGDDIIL